MLQLSHFLKYSYICLTVKTYSSRNKVVLYSTTPGLFSLNAHTSTYTYAQTIIL